MNQTLAEARAFAEALAAAPGDPCIQRFGVTVAHTATNSIRLTMLQRNLLYTGVTRGRKLVVLVVQNKAVAIAVRNASGRRRW